MKMGLSSELAELLVKITADGSGLLTTLTQVENKVLETSNHLMHLGETMTLGLTLPLQAFGAVATQQFASFDDALTKSTSFFTGMTANIRAQMGQAAKALSEESEFGPKELAQAYRDLGQSQMSAAEAMKALPAIEDFATAGMEDMAQATKQVVDIQGALGLRTKDVTQDLANQARIEDVLIKGSQLAHANTSAFADALTSKLGPVLASLHKPLEEGASLLALFASKGQDVAGVGSRLTIMLTQMQRQALENSAAWNHLLGPNSVFDQSGKMLPIVDIIQKLDKALAGASDRQRAAALTNLGFQGRMQATVIAMLGQSGALKEMQSQMEHAGGATNALAEIFENTFAAQLEHLEHRLQNVAIGIGEMLVPYVKMLNSAIGEGIDYWNSLSASTQSWIVAIGVGASLIGPFLVALGAIGGLVGIAIGMITGFGAALIAVATSPITLVIAGVVAVGAALVTWVGGWQTVVAWAKWAFDGIVGLLYNWRENFYAVTIWAQNAWLSLWQGFSIRTFITAFISDFGVGISAMISMMIAMLTSTVTYIESWIPAIVTMFQEAWNYIWSIDWLKSIESGLTAAWEKIKSWGGFVGELLKDIFTGHFQAAHDLMSKALGLDSEAESADSLSDKMSKIVADSTAKLKNPFEGVEIHGPKLDFGLPPVLAGPELPKFEIDTSALDKFATPNLPGGSNLPNTIGETPTKQNFSATELGTAEEYKARVAGSGNGNTVAAQHLDVAKKSLKEHQDIRLGVDSLIGVVKNKPTADVTLSPSTLI